MKKKCVGTFAARTARGNALRSAKSATVRGSVPMNACSIQNCDSNKTTASGTMSGNSALHATSTASKKMVSFMRAQKERQASSAGPAPTIRSGLSILWGTRWCMCEGFCNCVI